MAVSDFFYRKSLEVVASYDISLYSLLSKTSSYGHISLSEQLKKLVFISVTMFTVKTPVTIEEKRIDTREN